MSQSAKTIAVDGPAGSGKSTVAYAVAKQLDYLFVDTGVIYRAITFLALRAGISMDDNNLLARLAETSHIDILPAGEDDSRQNTVMVNGEDITELLHSPEVDMQVSVVSAVPGVRAALLGVQRDIAARKKVIMVGRDIATVVLPDADVKVYIDASLDARAKRRYHQRVQNGNHADYEEIRAGLSRRDSLDSGRDVAPLQMTEDAVYLDTSALTFDESVSALYRIIMDWNGHT